MIASPGLLVQPAIEGGIKVPDDELVHSGEYDPDEFPHWHVFMVVQLGRPMPTPTAHWDNAKVIGKIGDEHIKEATIDDLFELGVIG